MTQTVERRQNMYGNERSKTEAVDKPCWNMFWIKGSPSYVEPGNWHRDGLPRIKKRKNGNNGQRYYKETSFNKKLEELYADPDITEIHVTYTEPTVFAVRDGDGNWLHKK
jgi:hypothetical protein